jgi:hypothetical protein
MKTAKISKTQKRLFLTVTLPGELATEIAGRVIEAASDRKRAALTPSQRVRETLVDLSVKAGNQN